ncbi:MAG: hypothetical protein ACLFQU_00950 [Candidatus Kapaibacterium sp.]
MKTMVLFAILALLTISCDDAQSIFNPVSIENDSLYKGKDFRLNYDLNSISGLYHKATSDEFDPDNMYAHLCFLCKSKSLYYNLKLERSEKNPDKLFINFQVPSEAEYLTVDIKQNNKLEGMQSNYPVYDIDGKLTARGLKFKMQFSMDKENYLDAFEEYQSRFPYKHKALLETWRQFYNDNQNQMRIEVDSIYNLLNTAQDLRVNDKIDILMNTADAYSLLNDNDRTYRSLKQLDSIITIDSSAIDFSIFQDVHFLTYLSSRIPNNKNAEIESDQIIKKIIDISNKTGNHDILYKLYLMDHTIRKNDVLYTHFVNNVYNALLDDIEKKNNYIFARSPAILGFSIEHFYENLGDTAKANVIAEKGGPVLASFGFKISNDTNDITSIFNGYDAFYSGFLMDLAKMYHKTENYDKAKSIIKDFEYLVDINESHKKNIAARGCMLMHEIYKKEAKIDSADYYISLSDYLGNDKAKYRFNEYLKWKKEKGYPSNDLQTLKAKFEFEKKIFSEVPNLILDGEDSHLVINDISDRFTILYHVDEKCSACIQSLKASLKELSTDFDNYRVVVLSDLPKEFTRNFKNAPFEIHFVKRTDENLKAFKLKNERLRNNTIIMKQGKLTKFDEIVVPDYILKNGTIL